MISSRSARSIVIGGLLFAAAALFAPLPIAHAQSAAWDVSYPHRVPGVVYAQFREGYNPVFEHDAASAQLDGVQKILREIGVTKIEPFDADAYKDAISHKLGIDRMYVIYYASEAHPLGVTLRLLQTGLVQTASPRYIFEPQKHLPNDPLYTSGSEWFLDTIHCPEAWDITKGSPSVIIADVDEGVNYNHEDLAANMVDHGWNAASNTPDAMPHLGANEGEHGTETTGCFGGIMDNGIGMAGVAPLCKILAVRIANDAGQLTAGYEGIHYAATHNANVINCSWGGTIDPSALAFEQTFADEVTARGEVLVASAGNYSKNNDITPFYPANLDGALSVGATDPRGYPSSFTHYGRSVLVFAPGVDIMTTTLSPGNSSYTSDPGVDGTSFSGPITAGICGLLMSQDATLPPSAVKSIIIETCDPVRGQESNPDYHGRVNALAALNQVKTPSHPNVSMVGYQVNSVPSDSLRGVGAYVNLSVNFVNSAAPATNTISATLQPGPGYSWQNYQPQFPSQWPNFDLGPMDQHGTRVGQFPNVFRTRQFSEGTVPMKFFITDHNFYSDSLIVNVPLTSIPGMKHRLVSGHATCVKQVDSKIGWAGFGYFEKIHNPESGNDTIFRVTQYARRRFFGPVASRWEYSPTDLPAEVPALSIDALDDQTACFGGQDPITGASQVIMTADGGADWNVVDVLVPPRSIHLTSATSGWFISDAVSKSFQFYQTNDGGQSFTKGTGISAATTSEKTFYNGLFWDGAFGIFGGNAGAVHITTNGGSTWLVSVPIGGTAKQNNVRSIAFSAGQHIGFACVRGEGTNKDSAGLFVSLSKGRTWANIDMIDPNTGQPDPYRIPYSVTFKPGTDTAIITTNQGVFLVAQSGTSTYSWSYYSAPSSWDPTFSMVSASGNQGSYTISAVSEGSGIVDFSTEALAGVQSQSNASQLQMLAAPNPTSGDAQIYFSLPSEDHVTIRLVDVLGRTISEVFSGILGAGDHAIPVAVGAVTPGVYHCLLETASGISSQTSLVLMK
ncbi:MAG: S8 family serine peptidase [Bacteroidota bacterium]|nr:S8 family serine peptidase [Bacteroidota bacterium]MDP4232847.1 S8 family serine peptidase [Bacteroidota bacterium]MDP4241891.1 S8 family serine peptidase [Bacteroidota bacterium]MDP4288216.1 S8 family serine peptidase [Bacteroidota bacterium]